MLPTVAVQLPCYTHWNIIHEWYAATMTLKSCFPNVLKSRKIHRLLKPPDFLNFCRSFPHHSQQFEFLRSIQHHVFQIIAVQS